MPHKHMTEIIMLSARVGALGNSPSARMEAQILRNEIDWLMRKVIFESKGVK